MNQTDLMLYSREILPMVRAIEAKKQELKEYKETNEEVARLQLQVKQAQEELANYLTKDDNVIEFTAELKDATKELKQALKSAARASGYKPAELKTFFFARAKEKAVEKAVEKGTLFVELTSKIDNNA
jgi:hypothetical protein